MKRREFLKTSCQTAFVVTCTAAPLYSLLKGTSKSMPYRPLSLHQSDGIIELPASPEEYSSIVYLDVKQNELPRKLVADENIQGESEPFVLSEAGPYCIQYLGPFYGWSVS